ncbi:MAG: hypothetical protein HOP30_15925 [Cyclobacteriaceae bacterium]|nr:hypothetical protein [Cyclobacteriaceae bacterium]
MKILLPFLVCMNLWQITFTQAIAQEQVSIEGEFGPSVDASSSAIENEYVAVEDDGATYDEELPDYGNDYISDIEKKYAQPTERICQSASEEKREVKNEDAMEDNILQVSNPQISYEQDDLNIEAISPVRKMENKLETRRRRLEKRTMNQMATQLEQQRLRNEMRLSQQFEQAMQQNIYQLNIE